MFAEVRFFDIKQVMCAAAYRIFTVLMSYFILSPEVWHMIGSVVVFKPQHLHDHQMDFKPSAWLTSGACCLRTARGSSAWFLRRHPSQSV